MSQVFEEPITGEARDFFQRARLLEEMRGSWHHAQALRAVEQFKGLFV